ncbi:MAG: sugar phosphate isomerase/epimerase [Acidobacteriota bacterium]
MPTNVLTSRRAFLLGTCAWLCAGAKRSSIQFGLEIYSLRREAAKDLPATLDLIRRFGITEVEVPELYGRSAAELRRLLDKAGLKATAMMAPHARLARQIDSVAGDARALGAEYVVCSTIPHKQKHLVLGDCNQAAEDFNRWGKTLAESGLRLCYHTHGIEFDPSPDGTLFDTLLKQCDPRWINFEMDIFWIVYAYQDPVTWLNRYPDRFPLMHVKDLRKGTPLGGSPGDVPEEASVILGQGLVDIPATLRAAQSGGVRHYYIEDEAVDAARQIPESLRYLRSIGW